MENSKIEWTHNTFNPWIGCTKVSPGCLNCYAETLMDTRYGRVKWGKGNPRARTGEDNWKKPKQWSKAASVCVHLIEKARCNYCYNLPKPRVFCASLADWLDDEVPVEWLADLLGLINDTPHLDWLLLTKRPQNWHERVKLAYETQRSAMDMNLRWLNGTPPENVWLGTSAEDQLRWDERLPILLDIPAKVRFVSAEPLLGPIDMGKHRVNWLIVGGESGKGARPMEEEWVRTLRRQSLERGTAFHFKQWGGENKKATGRELDGRTWDELPFIVKSNQ